MSMDWGLIGGGEGSQIGGTHRIAAGLDGAFRLPTRVKPNEAHPF